jgi:hypothetical protein
MLAGIVGEMAVNPFQRLVCSCLDHCSISQLLRQGRAARYMCTLEATLGKCPRPEYVIQSAEAQSRVEENDR